MQDAGRKTSEKDRIVEYSEDFILKSLFDTRFMMFNSRYKVQPWEMVSPTFSLRRFGRMYYILKEGSLIKYFAGIPGKEPGHSCR